MKVVLSAKEKREAKRRNRCRWCKRSRYRRKMLYVQSLEGVRAPGLYCSMTCGAAAVYAMLDARGSR